MCSGGVFGNVKVTQKLKEMPQINACFVQPQMGDGGLCIGACALAYEENIILKKIRVRISWFLFEIGPEFSRNLTIIK